MSRMSIPKTKKRFSFAPAYKTIQEIITDHNLATLGDAYTNLVYSLYLSTKKGKPTGAKANNYLLSKALKQVGLRELLPSRTDRHKQADAAEALLVYVWLLGLTTITENVETLIRSKNVAEAFNSLISSASKKVDLLI